MKAFVVWGLGSFSRVSGEEKKKLTKQQLIDLFAQKGASIDSDEALLTK